MPLEGLAESDLRGVIIAPEPMTDEEFDVMVRKLSEKFKSDLLAPLFAGKIIMAYSYEEEDSAP